MSNECKYGVSLNLHYPGGCFNCEIDRLQAEIERMKPVLEAARYCFPPRGKAKDMGDAWNRLRIAVDAYKEMEAKDETK